ncbi:DNA-directed RNA polymerase specialized sigma subunit, sigma24 family [Nostoc flagelliforme CCNUN1]|uniref:DNA-directed RNA polymerase specialized sigma subunit, sigma24 family n=1 Tax=Nostoc flagelliforme CCNUN1 TaxID=2038116 RepID=A0A2K8SN33_9NOSO|nr:RNA polymerase subunit sigma-70 [Nostoc flagelliforme]AUB36723.1 DNA-directed RNA polymerase specialized sigma subunit, sigma24 family [Nostoc flagelliforme CCNUN1]
MQIPHFPEANHPLVKSLFHHSDHELLTLFQQNPDAGKYFTVIFCRYSPIVYTLIRHSARSPVQADYLFALTWRHIYYELGGLNLTASESGQEALTMQNWLINMTAFCINEIKLPPTEAIHYSLQATSPPLWCYVEQALDQLPPVLRLIVLMAQTFHWSETRIAAYLQAEGEAIAPNEVANFLQEGYRMLEDKLPTDIRAIYFGEDLAQL